MYERISSALQTQGMVPQAMARALEVREGSPLLEAADLLMKACVRAAVLYPDWARDIAGEASDEIDHLARRLVAMNLHLDRAG